MSDTTAFATVVLVTALAGLLVVVSSRTAERLRLPLPVLVLAGAAVVASLSGLRRPGELTVERVVTVALVAVLFDGGMHIGRRRWRSAVVPIGVLGVVGTLLTAAAGMALLRAFGFSWYVALLGATAVAPTDPAVVFSVLGRRRIDGRSGTILEGESGANDPVGIALMTSLLSAGALTWSGAASVAGGFALQMGLGALVGIGGGRILLVAMRRSALPGEGLYPLRTLAAAFALFGLATVAHGSGFLAVFAAGIVIGDEAAPFKGEVERFHGALASLGEIVAFAVLGLTVQLHVLARSDVWVPGVLLAGALALVIRPAVVAVCLLPARLERNERVFLALAGLKGAVPILLGGYLLTAHSYDAGRVYGIVVVVVTASVSVQGALVPVATRLLRLPVEVVAPQPFSVGVRLPDAPEGVRRFTVASGSLADGRAVTELTGDLAGGWITLMVRDGRLEAVRGETQLRAGDDVTVLGAPSAGPRPDALAAVFAPPPDGPPPDGGPPPV